MSQKRSFNRLFCVHCDKEVSKSTYYLHYSKFYNKSTCVWKKQRLTDRPDFNFSDTESSDVSEDEGDPSDFAFHMDDDHVYVRIIAQSSVGLHIPCSTHTAKLREYSLLGQTSLI